MGDLRVGTGGLAELASWCDVSAAASTPCAVPLAHSTFAATTNAVRAVNAEISVAGLHVTDRVTALGARVAAAATAYDTVDANAGSRLGF